MCSLDGSAAKYTALAVMIVIISLILGDLSVFFFFFLQNPYDEVTGPNFIQHVAYFVRAAAVYIKKIDNCDLGSNQWNQLVCTQHSSSDILWQLWQSDIDALLVPSQLQCGKK